MRNRGAILWAATMMVHSLLLYSQSIAQQQNASVAIIPDSMENLTAGDSSDVWNYSVSDSSLVDFSYFLPEVFRDETALKRYIRDPRFLQLRRIAGDTIAVDMIFMRALDIADGDVSLALLIAALATFDHFRLGIRTGIFGPIYLPLTLESNSAYKTRYAHLPRRILPDSLGGRKNDRDKMQHFFGSAYLAYVFNSKEVARSFGDFIEWGEPIFIVGGDFDERDKFANRLGQEFGMRLLDGEDVLPSDVLWGKGGREKK
jgi:hypothetical protein